MKIYMFSFESVEEAFGDRIVVTASNSSHA